MAGDLTIVNDIYCFLVSARPPNFVEQPASWPLLVAQNFDMTPGETRQ